MGAAIYWIGKVTGLNSIVSAILGYVIVAALAGGGIWAWSAHKYDQGYSAGQSQERIAWEETRKRDLAKQAARVASDQARINQIAADNLALQQKLDAEKADAALEAAIRKEAADQKPALPKSIAHALNGVR